MPMWIFHVCDRLMVFWLSATPTDFCRASAIVVVGGWILTREWR